MPLRPVPITGKLSAGAATASLGTVVFSNSNGVSFGLNGQTLTGSVAAGAGAFSAGVSTGGNSQGNTGITGTRLVFVGTNNITLSQNTDANGATISISGGAGAAGNTGFISAGAATASLGTVVFSNSNGVSFGANGQTITGSIATSLTNVNISAGTTSNNLSAVVFSNSNNFSFGLNGSTVTGSYTVPTVTNSSMTISDAATSGTLARLAFTNLNGVTLSLSTGAGGSHTIVGSVATSLTNFRVSGGTTSNLLSAITFSNSNGVSFGLNASTMTASVATSLTNINVSAGTTSNNLSAVTFSNSNGVSFGLNGSTITASVAAAGGSVNFSAGTTSNNLTAITFSNSNGISFGMNASTMTASVATSLTNINVSAGTTSNNLSAITFSNSNNMTFGLNGSTVTASYTAPNTFSAYANSNTTQSSSGTMAYSSLNFAGAGIASVGVTGGSVVISVPSGGGAGDGGVFAGVSTAGNTAGSTGTVSTGNFVFVGSGALTLSQSTGAAGSAATVTFSVPQTSSLSATGRLSISTNGSTISIGFADPPNGFYDPWYRRTNTAGAALVAGSWYLAPFIAPGQISGGRVNFMQLNSSTAGLFRDITGGSYVSSSSGGKNQSGTYSFACALWSQGTGTNSSRLESLWSNSHSWGWSHRVLVSQSGANSSVSVTVSQSISYIQEIGSDGAYTLSQFASNNNSAGTNTSIASNNLDSVGVSLRNMISNSLLLPVGFNTTITPGNYWMGIAWSTTTASATSQTSFAGASALWYSQLSLIGISQLVLNDWRNFGSTGTASRSAIFPYGVYTGGANMAPPQFIALSSDLATTASEWQPYFNFQNRGLTK